VAGCGEQWQPPEDGERDDAIQGQREAYPAAGAVTADDGHMTVYKAPAKLLTVAVVGFAFCYVIIESGILSLDPGTVVAWTLSLPLVALLAWLLCWVFRRATLVSDEAVGVRGLAGTRWIPWADIQVIAIERNTSAWLSSDAPRSQIVVYDWLGQRRKLPFLDEMNLRHQILRDVAREIVARWQQGRGPQWAPDPEVSRTVALGRRRRAETSRVLAWTIVAVSAAAAIFLVLLVV
jgi:hypothetical protein